MGGEQFIWFLWASSFMIPWALLYALYPAHRRIMLRASLFTMPFGLTEPLFVPDYWSPPSLFDLALRTGFDIESLIFCFAIGGIGVVLYNAITQRRWQPVAACYRRNPLHRHHTLALGTPCFVFLVLYFLPWNPIYAAIIAMAAGTTAALLCRPDLRRKTWVGGILFLALYALFVGGLEVFVPGYINEVWNLDDLTGILILYVPLEEYLFAFTFGTYWAGVYEHLTWQQSG